LENLPEPLKKVVDHFASLPGLGPKSALRIALYLLTIPAQEVEAFGDAIISLRSTLTICEECGGFSDKSPCKLCADPSRDHSILCVVPDWDGVMVLERTRLFKGRYLVLGGLLSPIDGKNESALRLELLRRRLSKGEVKEIILALGATRDSEMTESFLKDLIAKEFPKIQVTRLAQGIPVGSELKYVDKETLKQSLTFRQRL
jgi:recombination protein RecR